MITVRKHKHRGQPFTQVSGFNKKLSNEPAQLQRARCLPKKLSPFIFIYYYLSIYFTMNFEFLLLSFKYLFALHINTIN